MSPVLAYGVAIAVAAATLFGAIRLFGRRRAADEGAPAGAGTPRLRVLERRRVERGRSLVIVDAEGRRLLLGSTRGAWTPLADLGPAGRTGEEAPRDQIEEALRRALDSNRFDRGGSAR